jgi:hypothetical protein
VPTIVADRCGCVVPLPSRLEYNNISDAIMAEIKCLLKSRIQMKKLWLELRPRLKKFQADHKKVKSGTASAEEVLGALSGSIAVGKFDTAMALVNTTEWKKILEDKMMAELATHGGTVLVRVCPHFRFTAYWGGEVTVRCE